MLLRSSVFATLAVALCVTHVRADERMVSPPEDLKPGQKPAELCELVLRAYYIAADGPDEVYAVTDLGGGKDAYERYRSGICIKEKGDAIRIPEDLLLWISQLEGHRAGVMAGGHLCRAGTESRATPNDEQGTCRWTGVYRNHFPFTFELETDGRALRTLLSSVRVYRNGELAYAWSAGPALSQRSKLVVSGRELKRPRLPHMSPFDLRIAPADLTVDPEAIEKLSTHAQPEAQALLNMADEAPAYKELLAKLSKAVACAFKKPGDKQNEGAAPENDCSDNELKLPNVPKELEGLAGRSHAALENLERRLDADFAEFTRQAVDLLHKASRDAKGQDGAKAALDERVRDVGDYLNNLRRSLPETIRAAVQGSAEREVQLELYNSLAREIGARSDALDARHPNPPPSPGERAIKMSYGDNLQGFFLSAWNGVPMRLKDNVGFDFKGTVAIPIVDIGGMRLQWGASRLAEFRLAGGIMVFQEENFATDSTSDTVLRVAPQISTSLGTFRAGLAWVANQDTDFASALRLVLGVDLVKLITGTNFEAI